MNLRILLSLLDKLLLFLFVVEVAIDWVKVVRLPIPLRRLRLQNLLIGQQLLIMMLQILVRNDIVIAEVFAHVCRDFFL